MEQLGHARGGRGFPVLVLERLFEVFAGRDNLDEQARLRRGPALRRQDVRRGWQSAAARLGLAGAAARPYRVRGRNPNQNRFRLTAGAGGCNGAGVRSCRSQERLHPVPHRPGPEDQRRHRLRPPPRTGRASSTGTGTATCAGTGTAWCRRAAAGSPAAQPGRKKPLGPGPGARTRSRSQRRGPARFWRAVRGGQYPPAC